MNKFKKIITSKIFTISAFAVAAGLLIFSSVGGTQAALTYYSETYTSRVEMFDIGVSLLENGEVVSHRDYVPNSDYVWDQESGALLTKMLAEGEEVVLNKIYKEELAISNSGTINTYDRVNVYKYWLDENGDKLTNLDPDLIELNFVNIGSAWLIDEAACTKERTVLYYSKLLNAGETSPIFTDTVKVNGMVASKVTQVTQKEVRDGRTYTTITTYYDYDGTTFCIEAEVNAIQEHNAEAAAKSIWGREVKIANNTLALN